MWFTKVEWREVNPDLVKSLRTAAEVKREVAVILDLVRDDEAAHNREDSLYEAILRSIAAGRAENPKAMARAALVTKKIEFKRWCA